MSRTPSSYFQKGLPMRWYISTTSNSPHIQPMNLLRRHINSHRLSWYVITKPSNCKSCSSWSLCMLQIGAHRVESHPNMNHSYLCRLITFSTKSCRCVVTQDIWIWCELWKHLRFYAVQSIQCWEKHPQMAPTLRLLAVRQDMWQPGGRILSITMLPSPRIYSCGGLRAAKLYENMNPRSKCWIHLFSSDLLVARSLNVALLRWGRFPIFAVEFCGTPTW